MEKKDLVPVSYLQAAALYPQRRGEMIARALQGLLVCLPAVGTALIWPCQNRDVPWKVYYTGISRESMQHWLMARLDCSFKAILGVLQRDLRSLSDMPIPHLICLEPAARCPAGLLIVWTPRSPLLHAATNEHLGEVRRTLEALIEVESSEELLFPSDSLLSDPGLADALAQGDTQALLAFLSLTRLVGNAELAFWGRAHQDVIEMKDHLGARDGGFGFVIRRGQGIGGRVAADGKPIVSVDNYRTNPYRIPGICERIDAEGALSAIVLSVRSRTGQGMSGEVAGVLYATRRILKPFSLTERLLVQRMICLLEPLRPITRPPMFLSPGLPPLADQKLASYKVVLRANQR